VRGGHSSIPNAVHLDEIFARPAVPGGSGATNENPLRYSQALEFQEELKS
jgi:hypothetical protein